MLDSRYWRNITFVLILLVVPFFFVGGVSAFSPDIYRRLWDFGHSIFFALVAVNLVWWLVIKNHKQFCIVAVMVFCISLLIEKLQSYVGRNASWADVLSNMAGFCLAYSFMQIMNKWMLILRVVSILGVLPGLWAVLKSFILLVVLWQQFPVLSGGESHWESRAWRGKGFISRVDAQAHQQAHPQENPSRIYLVQYSGKAYQSIDLMGFIQSWSNYQTLVLEIENPTYEAFSLALRISDKKHEMSKQEFNDRFNRRINLLPGWNKIELPVSDIENSPFSRKMNLHDIYLLKLFLPESGSARQIYLNKIYLK